MSTTYDLLTTCAALAEARDTFAAIGSPRLLAALDASLQSTTEHMRRLKDAVDIHTAYAKARRGQQ